MSNMIKFGLIAVLGLLCGCTPAVPEEDASSSSNESQSKASVSKQRVQSAEESQPQASNTIVEEVDGVVDYAVGATALRAKQKSEAKIQQINQQHNAELEAALED